MLDETYGYSTYDSEEYVEQGVPIKGELHRSPRLPSPSCLPREDIISRDEWVARLLIEAERAALDGVPVRLLP